MNEKANESQVRRRISPKMDWADCVIYSLYEYTNRMCITSLLYIDVCVCLCVAHFTYQIQTQEQLLHMHERSFGPASSELWPAALYFYISTQTPTENPT